MSGNFHDIRPTRWKVLHHLLAALTIAAGTLVLEHAGLLGWLDAAMLRIVAAEPSAITPPDASTPTLVLIDNASFLNDFSLRSPLDREQLRKGFEEILAARPERLIIDLQLEPAVGETIDGQQAQRPLDRLLQDFAAHTHIALPLPEARSEALDAISLKWMQAMCRAGVEFGRPELREHFGAVVRLSNGPLSLASAGQQAPHEHAAKGGQGLTLCRMAEQVPTLRAMSDLLAHPVGEATPGPALRPSAVDRVLAQSMPWRLGEMEQTLAARAPKLVVAGGSYDVRDTFLLAGSTAALPGALVHAVAADTRAQAREQHLQAWIVDIVIGVVAGLLFEAAWFLVRKAQERFTAPIKMRVASSGASASNLAAALGLGALASVPTLTLWAGVLGISLWTLHASAWLLDTGRWLNPGPMILGMALHAQLLSQQGDEGTHEGGHGHGHGHAIANLRGFIQHHPFSVLQAAVGVIAFLILLLQQVLHAHN